MLSGKINKGRAAFLCAVGCIASSAMAQGFDPATEATSATTIVGTVFGIVFATIISIVIGLKVIKYIRGT